MKKYFFILSFCLIFVFGFWLGYQFAKAMAMTAILCGPYSDDYEPALRAISDAKVKLLAGDSNVTEELDRAKKHIDNACGWTRRYLGQPAHASDSERRKDLPPPTSGH